MAAVRGNPDTMEMNRHTFLHWGARQLPNLESQCGAYDSFRALSIASAQRYASDANLSCATSSASLSGRVAKAVEAWTWLNNAVSAATANLSRSSSSCSLAVVFTSTV